MFGFFDFSDNAETFVDRIIEYTRDDEEMREKLEPLVVERIKFDKGEAFDIRIEGLTTLERRGPIEIDFEDGRLVIEADIALDKVTGSGHYKYKASSLINLDGEIDAKCDSVRCFMKLMLKRTRASLKEFKVVGVSGFEVTRFTGASIMFNGLAKWIVNQVVAKRKDEICTRIEEDIQQTIEAALKEINIYQFLGNQN